MSCQLSLGRRNPDLTVKKVHFWFQLWSDRSPPSEGVGSSEKNWRRVRPETFISGGFPIIWEDCVGSGYLDRLGGPTDQKMFEKIRFGFFFLKIVGNYLRIFLETLVGSFSIVRLSWTLRKKLDTHLTWNVHFWEFSNDLRGLRWVWFSNVRQTR